MRKFIKLTLLSAVVIGAGSYFVFGKNAFSYAETAFNDIKGSVKSNVPIDFELRRARNLIEKIDPEIQDARRDVARAEVEFETLQGDIRRLDDAIAKNETKVHRLRGFLEDSSSGAVPASFGTRQLPPVGIIRSDLARTFDLYKNQIELRDSKKRLVERQAKVLEAARTKLHAVRTERQNVADLVEKLETRKRQLDAMAATARRFDIDTSALGEARELLSEIKKRLDVSQKMIQESVYYGAELPENDLGRDVAAEVDQFFGQGQTADPESAELRELKNDR
jgi:DNA repair exonuclease SbcCD ATPase subunit